MGQSSEVRDEDGGRVVLDDAAGGTFDAAGDFDRVIPADDPTFIGLASIDPYGEWVVPGDRLQALAAEVAVVRAGSRPGTEANGLDRLTAQIIACLDRPGYRLIFLGD